MNRDDIIRMAEQAGMERCKCEPLCHLHTGGMGSLTYFAKLIAAAEREACADICKQAAKMSELAKEDLSGNETGAICFVEGAVLQANKLCAAILARGQV